MANKILKYIGMSIAVGGIAIVAVQNPMIAIGMLIYGFGLAWTYVYQ
ncbi:hypothetical protein WE348_20420 (plasmid) [Alteromonas macleodii]